MSRNLAPSGKRLLLVWKISGFEMSVCPCLDLPVWISKHRLVAKHTRLVKSYQGDTNPAPLFGILKCTFANPG